MGGVVSIKPRKTVLGNTPYILEKMGNIFAVLRINISNVSYSKVY